MLGEMGAGLLERSQIRREMSKLSNLTDALVENILSTPDEKILDEMRIEQLEDLVIDLAASLTDEGPDWSFEGVASLRRRVASAIPDDERIDWLKPYVEDR